MVNTLEDLYLTPYSFLPSSLSDLRFFVSFYGNLLVLRFKDCHSDQRIRSFPYDLAHDIILLEFEGQIFGVVGNLELIFFIGNRKPRKELIIIFFYLQKLDQCIISATMVGQFSHSPGGFADFCLHPDLLIRLFKEFFDILFGHAIGGSLVIEERGSGLMHLNGGAFPGMVKVDLLEGVDELTNCGGVPQGTRLGIII